MKHLKETVDLLIAVAIFDKFADRKGLAFSYKDDGCHARAHFMCNEMIHKMGILPMKVWATPHENQKLKVITPEQTIETIWENFHIAPVIQVRMPNNDIEKLVIDPALFDGPVSIDIWAEKINADIERVELGALKPNDKNSYDGNYGPNTKTNKSADYWAQRQLIENQRLLKEKVRTVFTTVTRQEALMQQKQMLNISTQDQLPEETRLYTSLPIKTSGKTWRTLQT